MIGIYIKTFKPDHYLAKALIASVRHYAPGVPIMVLPDDGYDRDTIWGEKVLNVRDPFLLSLKGYFKKLWVFFGPYERFIYTDADALILRPLAPLIQHVNVRPAPLFSACEETKMRVALAGADADRREGIYRNMLGRLDLMRQFDPEYDPFGQFPFPSGFFVADKRALPMGLLTDAWVRLCQFHAKHRLAPPHREGRQGVFNADQGFLNYLIAKTGIQPDWLRNAFAWGGKPVSQSSGVGPFESLMIHWAGCPRPTFLRRDVPAGKEWIRFYHEYYRNLPRRVFIRDTATNVREDLTLRLRNLASNVKRRFLRR